MHPAWTNPRPHPTPPHPRARSYVSEKESSIVIKRFLFEAFDCYIALFYIAFYELDVAKLRSELVSLYTVDSIRRIATESLLPYLIERFNDYQRSASLAAAKKDDDLVTTSVVGEDEIDPTEIEHVVAEILRDEHEAFDEYLEMVIELGELGWGRVGLGEVWRAGREREREREKERTHLIPHPRNRLRHTLCSRISSRCTPLPALQLYRVALRRV